MELGEYAATHHRRLVRSVVLMGCPPSDAEDIVQTAMLRCHRSWRRAVGAASTDAYVYRVLVNTLADARARRWGGELPTEDLPDSARPDMAGAVVDGLSMRNALAVLSPEHREVLVLRFYADLSERDVARVVGVAPGTIKSRTARALAALAADPAVADPSTDDQGARS